MKILLLGSQHGNELLGEKLYAHIKNKRPDILPYVTHKNANLRARRQNVRYIESDLNRSYNGKNTTYEERRARVILRYIQQQDFDLVLDLHTTTCKQIPCLITPGITPELQRFMRASSIETIVEMSHDIVKTSLIGVHRKSISVEVNRREITSELLESLCDDLLRFIQNRAHGLPKKIYKIDDLLHKKSITSVQAKTLKNFEYSPLGFYPVLVGENSYKKQTDYLGFKAYTVRVCKV